MLRKSQGGFPRFPRDVPTRAHIIIMQASFGKASSVRTLSLIIRSNHDPILIQSSYVLYGLAPALMLCCTQHLGAHTTRKADPRSRRPERRGDT